MSPADAFLLPLIGTVLLLTAALVGGIALDAPRAPPPVVPTCTRTWDDPMVSTHLWALFPFALAVYLRMPLTAGIVLLAAGVSIWYHARCERGRHLPLVDEVTAGALAAWTVLIFVVSLTLRPHWGLVGACIAVLCIAMGAYVTGLDARPSPRDTPDEVEENARDASLCARARLHPLWHLAGFVAIGLVLTNFRRANAGELLSDRPWLRALQQFHF